VVNWALTATMRTVETMPMISEDEEVGSADRAEDRVPPALATGELLVDPDVVTRPSHVLQQ